MPGFNFKTSILGLYFLLVFCCLYIYPSVCEVGDCDFEDGLCGWTNSFDDDFDWGRRRFPTRTPLTGPTGDHTYGNGRFVYLEGNNARNGSFAKFVSPVLTPSTSGSKLNILYFWYSMWDLLGGNMGTLNVWMMHDGRLGKLPIWSRDGPQTKRSEWREVELVLHSASPFQIVFEGIVGNGARSDIGIDDIKFVKTDAPKRCDFESNILGPFCGFYQDDTDDFDWTLQSGETPSLDTGPLSDFTFLNVTNTGHYIFIETTRQNDEKSARLISLPYFKEPDSLCLFDFKYHMFGANVGELNIYIQDKKIWSSQLDGTVDRWQDGRVDLRNISGYYQVKIEGIRGNGNLGDIAIDDVSFLGNGCTDIDKCASNPCQHDGNCTQTSSQFVCACAPGWTGLYCQLDIQECRSNPCNEPKSRCIEGLNGYTCQCPKGLTGEDCKLCADHWQEPDCSTCQPQWYGENCDTCANAWTGAACDMCPDNWSGSNCDRCSSRYSGKECQYCSARFTGPDCTLCSNGWTGEECGECPVNWAGDNCDTCSEGWTGSDCQVSDGGSNDKNKGIDPENIPLIISGIVGSLLVLLITSSFVIYFKRSEPKINEIDDEVNKEQVDDGHINSSYL